MTTRSCLRRCSLVAFALLTAACQTPLPTDALPWQAATPSREPAAAPESDGTPTPDALPAGRTTCVPDIAPRGAWLAADGGRSIPLPNGTSIHLFGDTLLAEDGDRPVTFVGNSIGVAACDGPDFKIDYAWRDDGHTRGALFDTGDPAYRMWPVDAFIDEGRMYVVLTKVVETDEGLGFGYAGTMLATVDNPLDAPAEWSIGYRPLTEDEGLWPVKGAVVNDGYVYLYSELHSEPDGAYPFPTGLARLAVSDLELPAKGLEYMAVDDTWKPIGSFAYDDAFVVTPDASTTMYVHHHAGLGKWVTIQADSVFGSPNAVMRSADTLEGPWSEPRDVFQFPEMQESDAAERGVVCYAVTEHPQYGLDDENTLVVTYACNTLGTIVPMDDLDLYLPKTVIVDLGLDDAPVTDAPLALAGNGT